jgi:SpoVK/Ycf46/Vps4 family AAA+-type ATPase
MAELYTGERISRLVIVDASQFWDPLFGMTEQRIAAWAEKIQKLGSQKLRGRDGRELRFPLLVAIEECESLLRQRGERDGSGHLFDRPLALLLQKIESLESALDVPIIFIATSNRPDLADAAALRRLGMRQVIFGSLCADEARAVLEKKTAEPMKLFDEETRGRDAARDALVRAVLGYLYGPVPRQPLAEVRLGNSERRVLNRRDVVTPAVIEEAVSAAVDRSLRKSRRAGRLVGLDAADVIGALERHFTSLARNLRPHNLAEHAADWFERERPMVMEVVPLTNGRRHVPLVA